MIDKDLQEPVNTILNFDKNEIFFTKNYDIQEVVYVEPHFHKWLEIVYYYNGTGGEVEMNSRKYIYTQGEFVVVRPYTVHAFQTFSPQRIIILGLDCSAFLTLFLNSCLENNITGFLEQFYKLPPVCRNGDTGFVGAMEQLKQLPLLPAVRTILQLGEAFAGCAQSDESAPVEYKFFKAIHFLENNFHTKITVEDAAQQAGVSSYYFSRKFKEQFQVSFSSYLNKIRLDKACYLLLHTPFTISEIVYKVGFQEASYFNRLFKQAYQLTPLEYRKQHQAGPPA